MPLRNYTSEVPVDRSISRIEAYLVQAGATHVSKGYGPNGEVTTIVFNLAINEMPALFRLPVRVESCYKALLKDRKSLSLPAWSDWGRQRQEEGKKRLREQAARTAFRILEDWVSVQVSLVQLEQAEAVEVFLPYAYNPEKDQTLFESMKETKFKALLPSAAGK